MEKTTLKPANGEKTSMLQRMHYLLRLSGDNGSRGRHLNSTSGFKKCLIKSLQMTSTM